MKGKGRKNGRAAILWAVLMMMAAYMSPGAGAQPPASGDWVVTGSEVLNDTDLTLEGNLVVKAGGSLSLENVTLRMDAPSDGALEIRVEKGASLALNDSWVQPVDSTKRPKFMIMGTLTIKGSHIVSAWGDDDDWLHTGVVVDHGTIVMEYSLIEKAALTGLCLDGATATFIGSNLNANGWAGLFASASSITMLGTNVFDNLGPGIHISNGTTMKVDRGWLGTNGRGGVVVSNSTFEAVDSSISTNKGNGLEALDTASELVMSGGLVTSNAGWGIVSAMSNMTISGTNWSLGGAAPNSLGNVLVKGDAVVKVTNARTGAPWEGAKVEIVPASGQSAREAMTDDTGQAMFKDVTHYMEGNGTGRRYETPYTIRCSEMVKGLTISGETANVNEELWSQGGVTCKLSLPDLEISGTTVDRASVVDGDIVTVTASILNNASNTAPNVTVELFDGTTKVDTMDVGDLGPMQGTQVSFKYRTSGKVGKHEMKVVVDPGDKVPEDDELDNDVTLDITVNENPRLMLAIPILIIVGLAGFGAFRFYQWAVLRRLERERKEKGDIEWEEVRNGNRAAQVKERKGKSRDVPKKR